ncbi:MAG: hypothetical protein F6K23_11100 [Okeania sp. SIO2C9]|nr:hypothetical protein [Okeania sp. SIO2C9]NEQ73566.1 hypothetical protein [Okeania sp. SIO2C9]
MNKAKKLSLLGNSSRRQQATAVRPRDDVSRKGMRTPVRQQEIYRKKVLL